MAGCSSGRGFPQVLVKKGGRRQGRRVADAVCVPAQVTCGHCGSPLSTLGDAPDM